MNHSQSVEPPNLARNVRQALKQWHGPSHSASPLADLYLFRQAERTAHTNPRQVTNQLLLNAIEVLRQTHESAAHLLQKRFLDLMSIIQLANQLNVAESTVYGMQREAIDLLTDTVRNLEQAASAAQKALLEQRLPAATYVHLIGVDEQLAHLLPLLTAPQPPWVVAIAGIGGIGKTSLAQALTRHSIQHALFDEVGWVSAQQSRLTAGGVIQAVEKPTITATMLIEKLLQQLMPDVIFATGAAVEKMLAALRTRLKATPHLIVIDNLETLADVESLLPTLQDLANPTKFILTSRKSLYIEPAIYHFLVPELSERDALKLIRQEAQWSNLPVLAESSDEVLKPIYQTVGGNPLALRLVVGQTHIHTLESILYDLRMARGSRLSSSTPLSTATPGRVWIP
ncbi:MAG: AAA family ATPase [Caldilineaceae bacterium]|nr:AAA family ATPase [Caldilineaceae bacterium]